MAIWLSLTDLKCAPHLYIWDELKLTVQINRQACEHKLFFDRLVYNRQFHVLPDCTHFPAIRLTALRDQLLLIAMLFNTPVTIEHVTLFLPSFISPLQKQGF